MPYKKGGGNHLQYYDEADGQYDEETRRRMNEADMRALSKVHYFGYPYDELIFHWPVYGLHDSAYCELFVEYARKGIHGAEMDIRKCDYLLKYDEKDDKSAFLSALGYGLTEPSRLRSDILCHTDLRTLTYSRYTKGCLRCVAKTDLHGKFVTTVWELKKDFTLRLITLIPGGDKKWK